MKKISDSLKELINDQPYYIFGLSHGLFNLSSLSRFLKKQVEIRTKKNVETSAILMNLSRMQGKIKKMFPKKGDFNISSISVQSNLCSITYDKTDSFYKKIDKLYQDNKNYLISLSQSTSEFTLITTEDKLKKTKEIINILPRKEKNSLSSLSCKFNVSYVDTPGFLYYIIQQLTFQNINIHEIASTLTEIIIYVDNKDIKLAFNTMHNMIN